MTKKIKVLALMDSPTVSTGFASVSKNVLKQLHKTGKYDITVVGINYDGTLTKEQIENNPYSFTPAQPHGYLDVYGRGKTIQILTGNDRVIKPPFDILFTIQDHFILCGADPLAEGYNFSARIKDLQAEILEVESYDINYLFSWIGYYPVDGTLQRNWVEKGIAYCDFPVAYTNYGKDQIMRFNNDIAQLERRLSVIPHGVDTNSFYPITEEKKKEFRKKYFPESVTEDSFLICNISRNQIRKDISSTLKIFSEYKKINPKAVLYIHARQKDQGGDIWEIAKQFGLEQGKDLLLPNGFNEMFGVSIEDVNNIYNVSDVLLTTTLGEGWGFINTEAMAVKKPVIAPANSSIPEIFGMDNIYEKEVGIDYLEANYSKLRGIPVKSGYNSNDFVCFGMVDNGVIRPKVDINDAVAKLDWVYKNKDKVNKIVENGYEWVQKLSWEEVCRSWEQLFDKAYQELQNERANGHLKKPVGVFENENGIKHYVDRKGNKIKIKPNEKCFCKSGKKFKYCHGITKQIKD